MEISLTIVFTVFGMAIGSFLNVCIDRLPGRRSIVYPPSQCDSCRHPLMIKDLIPVFSYLFLKGRCRYCGAGITSRSLWVELATGVIFGFNYIYFGLGWDFAIITLYGCVFLVLLFIDLEKGLILNKIVYPMAVIALVIDVFWVKVGIVSGLIGGVAGLVFLLIPALVYPKGMGFGDVKMAGLIGLVTGFPVVLVALMMGIIGGALVGGALVLLGIKKRQDTLPFGVFLSLATIAALYWGRDILEWYLGLF